MSTLEGWTESSFTDGGVTHPTYRRGEGPGVIIIHELPGMTPNVITFASEVVDAGFTVVMPNLFGTPGVPMSGGAILRTLPKVCVSREFTMLVSNTTSPVATWLRALARTLHGELGGPGVGALGMCFTGGFALAMMVDPSVAAPVLAQPSLPFAIGRRRANDLGLSPADLDVVKSRVAAGCPVLGIQYASDAATGSRFARLEAELGSGFLKLELAGKGHSTLTEHRQQQAVDRVLDFFGERLRP
jgi:dienelactone hydrolase